MIFRRACVAQGFSACGCRKHAEIDYRYQWYPVVRVAEAPAAGGVQRLQAATRFSGELAVCPRHTFVQVSPQVRVICITVIDTYEMLYLRVF